MSGGIYSRAAFPFLAEHAHEKHVINAPFTNLRCAGRLPYKSGTLIAANSALVCGVHIQLDPFKPQIHKRVIAQQPQGFRPLPPRPCFPRCRITIPTVAHRSIQ
jgi:hypothetical protein